MMNLGNTELLAENFGGWQLSFTRAVGAVGDRVLAVQIDRDGLTRARLSISNYGLDEHQACATLREKARRWIVEYESRPHMGDTDFSSI